MAGAQHPAVQRLQFFLSESRWDADRVNSRRLELLLAKDGKTLENYVTIECLLSTEAIAPSGAACLTLACQHRAALLP